jgi:predicted dehydrogenase
MIRQTWPLPAAPRPIVIIGTGGIVKDAHLPAYRKAGFEVAGVYDLDLARAAELAAEWNIPTVFGTLSEAVEADAVFDVAVPPVAQAAVLETLPEGATVLLQKPMGLDLVAATRLRDIARARKLTGAVNFQLRYSPMMLAIAGLIHTGTLGELTEIEVHINLVTPWDLFPHLIPNPRVEIVSHSIHYLDTIRALAGDPQGVFARSYGHPSSVLAQTRTTAILDYGPTLRTTISINHHHDFGRKFQDASFRVEGTQGMAVAKLGVLLDYPNGEPDELWFAPKGGPAEQIALQGAWFPDAFIGPMANLQRFVAGEDSHLATHFEDAWRTMALVETCYIANETPSVRIPE